MTKSKVKAEKPAREWEVREDGRIRFPKKKNKKIRHSRGRGVSRGRRPPRNISLKTYGGNVVAGH